MNRFDQGWVVGLIEGEGSFVESRKGSTFRIQVKMTDLDTIERLADLLGTNVLGPYQYAAHADGHSRKPFWFVSINGPKAEAIARWLLPHLSARRRARIEELLGTPTDLFGFEPSTSEPDLEEGVSA